jgi:large subunit ribosomal protein L17
VEKLFVDLAKRYPDRTSGYLRTTRLPNRVGDNSPLMLVELMPGVDEAKAAADAEAKPRRRLSLPRRAAKPAEDTAGATGKTSKATKTTAKKSTTAAPKKTTSGKKSSSEED